MKTRTSKVSSTFKIIFILTLLLTAAVAIFFSTQKSGYIMDENFTYGLSNSYFQPFPYRFNEWVPSSFYENYLTVNTGERFAFDSVYYNQVNDVHPPLFYYFVHIISSIFTGSFSKWIVISLNLLFLMLTFFVVYKLSQKILDNRWYALLISAFWGLSVGTISSVLFLRMYVMLTFFFTLLLYFGMNFIFQRDRKLINLLFISLTLVAGSLTHYYFLVYSFFLILTLSIILLVTKRYRDLLIIDVSSLFSIALFYLLFPSVLDHLQNSDRGNEAVNNLTGGTSNLIPFLNIINDDLFSGIGEYLLLTLAIVLLIKIVLSRTIKSSMNQRYNLSDRVIQYVILLAPVLFYIVLIQRIAPYQTSRYVYAVYPAIIVGISLILIDVIRLVIHRPRINIALTTGILSLIVVSGHLTQGVGFTNNDYDSKKAIIEENSHLDVLVLTSARWRIVGYVNELAAYSDIYPQLSSDEEIRLPEDDILENSDELIIYIDTDFSERMDEVDELLRSQYGFTNQEKLFEESYSTVYLYQQ